jgi:hypothetical protein
MLAAVLSSCEQGVTMDASDNMTRVEFIASVGAPTPLTRTVFTPVTTHIEPGVGDEWMAYDRQDMLLTWEEDETVDVLHVNNENPSLVARSATIGGTRLNDKTYSFSGNVRNLAEDAQGNKIEHYEYFYPGGTAYYTTASKEKIVIDLSSQQQLGNGTTAHLKKYMPIHWSLQDNSFYPNIYGAIVHVTFNAPSNVLSLEVSGADLFATDQTVYMESITTNTPLNSYNQLGNNFDFALRSTPAAQRHGPIALDVHTYESSKTWEFFFVVGPSEQIDNLYLRVVCPRAIVIENNRVREIETSFAYTRQLYDGSDGSKQFKAGKYYEFVSNPNSQ